MKNNIEYHDLRKKYLNLIVKYVQFDKADILYNEDYVQDEKKEVSKTGKTKRAADQLREGYPELYDFLFEEGKLKRENLRMLLAGPENMPASFGGKGNCFQTMHEFLEWIKEQCMPQNREEAKNICKGIFRYYDGFGKSDEAYSLLRNLKVRVCPYCNRMFTITLRSKEELGSGEKSKTTRPTFDHFFPYDECPFLALNLFNLIPSCHTCNGNKHVSRDDIIYPYDESFGKKAVFRVIPQIDSIKSEEGNPFAFLMGESDSFTIKFMGNNGITLLEDSSLAYRLSDIKEEQYRKRIEHSIELFHLEEQYCEHKLEIRDILKKAYYFNEQYVKSVICPMVLEKMWRDGHGEISKEQLMDVVMDMIFFSRIRQEEWGERPLSKLISDILDQVTIL